MARGLDDLMQRGVSYGDAVARLAGSGTAAPAAMTAPTNMGAAYTQTEVQALRTDVANLRATVASLLAFINSGD
jgi:hypothetical protein